MKRIVLAMVAIGALAIVLAMWRETEGSSLLRAAAATVVPPSAVHTCAQDLNWTRPTEGQMAQTVWRDNRYRDTDGSVPWLMRAYYERHFMLFTTPTGSGVSHAIDLSGLRTAGHIGPELCGAEADPALLDGHEVAIWSLGYRVTGAAVSGETLAVTVVPNQPTTRGYQIVQMLRPAASRWSAQFVLADGTDVARWSTTDRELTARSATEPCTGAIIGRVVADYGSHAPGAHDWISLSGLDPHRPDALVNSNIRAGPDGSFRVENVPVGQHVGAARHARFDFTLKQCGQTLDVGIVLRTDPRE